MIPELVAEWESKKNDLRSVWESRHPSDYKDLVKETIRAISGATVGYRKLDPERITEIDEGDYQGTLVYVIGETGYQPSTYWAVLVSYGSCSGCDTLQLIRGYGDDTPSEDQVDQYMTLCLHVVQKIRNIGEAV